MHKDLRPHRTCGTAKMGKQMTMAETNTNCGNKSCITCRAKIEGSQMLDTVFDIEQSTAIARFVEMKEEAGFKDWTVQENIDKFSGWLAMIVQTEKK
eukprot:6260451-Heterocapsa_arctica.AAC.1